MKPSIALYVPTKVGRAALDELHRIPWERLRHAYGIGKREPGLAFDVDGTLRKLGDPTSGAMEDALEAFFSNLCHQGTIYEATAYAVPFLAAILAGTDLSTRETYSVIVMLGSVGVSATFETKSGTCAGSFGEGVAELTRCAIRESAHHLSTAAQRTLKLWQLAHDLEALAREPPDRAAVERIEAMMDDLETNAPPSE